jgi:hypothetical protein
MQSLCLDIRLGTEDALGFKAVPLSVTGSA